MKNSRRLLLLSLGGVLIVAALLAIFVTPRPATPPPTPPSTSRPVASSIPAMTKARATSVSVNPTQTPVPIVAATLDTSSLPTVTPLAPGEPTLPPDALAMRAAPTATPSPVMQPTNTVVSTPTPTSVPATGKDNVPMIEIPSGEFVMGNSEEQIRQFHLQWYESHKYPYEAGAFFNEVPRQSVHLYSYTIDKVEVTNFRYRECVQAGYCSSSEPSGNTQANQIPGYANDSNFDDYPVFTSWYGANIYCQWIGKRLPTEIEWEKAARGSDERQYTWGNQWDKSESVMKLSPVGSNPLNISPFGVLDMGGNAPEWTFDNYELYPGASIVRSDLQFVDINQLQPATKTIRGKSGDLLESRVTVRTGGNPTLGLAGVRCVSGSPLSAVSELTKVVLIPTLVPTLAPMAEGNVITSMVYVPAGEFLMGRDTQEITPTSELALSVDETPKHVVYLSSYYIDRTEVTTSDYVEFLNALSNTLNIPADQYCDGNPCATWGDPSTNYIGRQNGKFLVSGAQYKDTPVSGVSWQGANAYCQWRGKHLPTEAEWEKAARGTDGRPYPWGNRWSSGAVYFGQSGREHSIGSSPLDISPYGAQDMLGSVYEWVTDYYADDFYALSPLTNPVNSSWAGTMVVRGGDPAMPESGITVRRGQSSSPSSYTGFRCAYSP